jgi:CMD domain protein
MIQAQFVEIRSARLAGAALNRRREVDEPKLFTSDGDVIDAIAGVAPGSRIDRLRRRRGDVFRHVQGSHDVLLFPQDEGGVGRAERAAIALRVALIAKDERLAAHYRALLSEAGGSELIGAIVQPDLGEPRFAALLHYADLVSQAPDTATPEDVAKLRALGFTSRDIVVVAQLVAFVSFQIRLLAGMRILREERS